MMGLRSDYGFFTGCMVQVGTRYASINYICIVDEKVIIQGEGEIIMCLAIFKPAKVSIPPGNLDRGWQKNPDGAGFAYVHKGKIHIVKGLMTLKEFRAAYDAASKKFKDSPFLIHFRVRSQGDKNAENTHPFMYKHGAMIHNGNIDGTGAVFGTGKSDTALFMEKFGDNLDYETLKDNKEDFDKALQWNKLVFLYPDKKHIIVNEKSGNWDNDVWYSTHAYKDYAPAGNGWTNRAAPHSQMREDIYD